MALIRGQITNSGYVYDGLGRNTLIAAVDAPVASAGAISLNYKINDQVSFISQGSSTTSYMYDALGRRVSEPSSGVVSSSHYSDGSDNPAWVTQTGGVGDVSEIYTASLGSGLRVFTKEVSGLVSASVQLSDVRGNTVTSFDLGSKTVSGWSTFDAFGNAEGVVSKSGFLGYGAYGQRQRATTASGLMLMGVRVYNPVTNQFSSVDAVSGGNETPYGYPNYPVNKNDFSGLWGLWDTVDVVLTIAVFVVPALAIVKVASIAFRAAVLLAKVTKASRVIGSSQELTATRNVSNLAGRLWTRSSKKLNYFGDRDKSAFQLRGNTSVSSRQYRSPVQKQYSREELRGKYSNYEARPKSGGRWETNIHVREIPGTFWRP